MPVVVQTLEVVESSPAPVVSPGPSSAAELPRASLRSVERKLRQEQVRRARLRAH